MSVQDQQIQKEKEELMREFKQLQQQLYDLKRTHESYAREAQEKDALIERLKEAKITIDHELEILNQENLVLRESNDKLTNECTDLKSELNHARNQVSKVEVQLENCIKQRTYLKEQIEVISHSSIKGTIITIDHYFYYDFCFERNNG